MRYKDNNKDFPYQYLSNSEYSRVKSASSYLTDVIPIAISMALNDLDTKNTLSPLVIYLNNAINSVNAQAPDNIKIQMDREEFELYSIDFHTALALQLGYRQIEKLLED